MIIAVLGLSGSGKDTICNAISKKLSYERGEYFDNKYKSL